MNAGQLNTRLLRVPYTALKQHCGDLLCCACSGGVAGLAAAWTIGPRLGRFNGSEVKPIVGHNVESIALGTFLLWMGWCAPSLNCLGFMVYHKP